MLLAGCGGPEIERSELGEIITDPARLPGANPAAAPTAGNPAERSALEAATDAPAGSENVAPAATPH